MNWGESEAQLMMGYIFPLSHSTNPRNFTYPFEAYMSNINNNPHVLCCCEQDMQNHEHKSLVLSADAKPRLKWTTQLHERFVDAVNQIGGPDKATPKSLMRVMGIPGLTLYHLKSHLQKYRLGKNNFIETFSESNQEGMNVDCKDRSSQLVLFREGTNNQAPDPIQESVQISRAIQMQMEIQRKLHEQIEVQRHLQLRIEAQGKYLQKVLKKAQETLGGCTEDAKAELSQLVSMINSGCLSSSLSELTEMRGLSLEDLDRQIQIKGSGGSVESSSETSSLKEDKERVVREPQLWMTSELRNQVAGAKRRENEEKSEDTETRKRVHRLKEMLDLNSQYQGHPPIDLNSTGIDQFNDITLVS